LATLLLCEYWLLVHNKLHQEIINSERIASIDRRLETPRQLELNRPLTLQTGFVQADRTHNLFTTALICDNIFTRL
jgi:hypothetical protein